MIAALFVATGGCYFGLPDVDPWDQARDARLYAGPLPVVAHPPRQLWVNLAAVNWKRYGKQKPAWYEGGDDGGCFESALASVRRYGGVLEHPAESHAWDVFSLRKPTQPSSSLTLTGFGWALHRPEGNGLYSWACEVSQSAYGHAAQKRTWLYFVGCERPPELDRKRIPGTHQVGWFDRVKPTLSKREASATPITFRDVLLSMARSVAAASTASVAS